MSPTGRPEGEYRSTQREGTPVTVRRLPPQIHVFVRDWLSANHVLLKSRDGHVLVTGTLPVAGEHVTNDLSIGLRVTAAQAELLKLRWARGTVQTRDKADKVWLNGDGAFGDHIGLGPSSYSAGGQSQLPALSM